jgi:hypothetical protein
MKKVRNLLLVFVSVFVLGFGVVVANDVPAVEGECQAAIPSWLKSQEMMMDNCKQGCSVTINNKVYCITPQFPIFRVLRRDQSTLPADYPIANIRVSSRITASSS